MHHQTPDITSVAPESIVRERLDFVLKQIFRFTIPEIDSDAILWRDERGLQRVYLKEAEDTTIGRDLASDVVLNDDFATRTHAIIKQQDGVWFAYDKGSRNGTWVNNRPTETTALHSGDIIRIGNTYFVFMEASCATG